MMERSWNDGLPQVEQTLKIEYILKYQNYTDVPIRYHAAHLARMPLSKVRQIEREYRALYNTRLNRNKNVYRGKRRRAICG